MFKSGTLLTYILFKAQRTPLCVRARNTTEKPPGKQEEKKKHILNFYA